jgi:hypothetical protein
MNNTSAEDTNTHAASPVSIWTPPDPSGLCGASFPGSVSEMFLFAEEVVNKARETNRRVHV